MRRPVTAALTLALAAVLLSACAGADTQRSATYGGTGTESSGRGCDPVEHPPEQSGGHLLGEATPPGPYSSTPPTSGWHAAGLPRRGALTRAGALSEPEQVTILELGGIVITWNGLDDAARAILEAFVDEHAEVVASTPYDKLPPGELVLAAWGVLQRCGSVDVEAIQAFVDEHEGGGPEH